MVHEQMFDPADPLLERVRELALSLPGAAEKVSHGRPTFFTTKVFCYYGGSIKVDGSYVQHAHSMLVHPDAEEARALLAQQRCFRPAYLGPSGWVGVDLGAATEWAEVSELVDASFRQTAQRSLIAELDTRTNR